MNLDYLPCPLCDWEAIPASCYVNGKPCWTEDDEATCPGCGARLAARVTGDGETEWMEAEEVEP